jgi:hypothetical protein
MILIPAALLVAGRARRQGNAPEMLARHGELRERHRQQWTFIERLARAGLRVQSARQAAVAARGAAWARRCAPHRRAYAARHGNLRAR